MMQGDSYYLGFTVKNNAGAVVTPEDVLDVEITVGHLRKTYLRGEIVYGEERWYFPLSQAETFAYWPQAVKGQIRVRWKNGIVEGKAIRGLRINESISKEVL